MNKKICILGLTVSGNRGAESMLLAIMKHMDSDLCSYYDLVSVYPNEDSAQNPYANLNIVSGKPLTVLTAAILSCLLGWARGIPGISQVLSLNPILRSILESELVLDSSGVAFIDGRGIPLLGYNACLCLPAVFLRKPIVKLSQALGPFETTANRTIASFVLPRLQAVIARGEITKSFLDTLKLSNTHLAADSAFVMPIADSDRAEADKILANTISVRASDGSSVKKMLGISPSTVVDAYVTKEGRNYPEIMADFIASSIRKGFSVVLIPHSVRPGSEERMNNDLIVCKEIVALLKKNHSFSDSLKNNLTLIDKELSAPVLRSLIGKMDFYIASRFHSMVSSLAMQNPTVLVGWSHKYREVMRMFDLEDYALSFSDLSSERLSVELDRLIVNEEDIRNKLALYLPQVEKSSRSNFTIAKSFMLDKTVPKTKGDPQ